MTNDTYTPDGDRVVTETHLGQLWDATSERWLDYARGGRDESLRWQLADPENRRVVDWIYKERVIVPPAPSSAQFDRAMYVLFGRHGLEAAKETMAERLLRHGEEMAGLDDLATQLLAFAALEMNR